MYINYKLLYQQGLDDTDYHNLQKIFQKEELYLSLHCEVNLLKKYATMGLTQNLKSKGSEFSIVRLSRKGKAFMTAVEQIDLTEEIAELVETLVSEYTSVNKFVGNKLEVQSRLAWFIAHTGFNVTTIRDVAVDYLTDNTEYTLSLENLIWKPPSKAFSVHKNLKDSKLFDLICTKFKLDHNFLEGSKKNKSFTWLQNISMLKIPKNLSKDMYLTDSYNEDINLINKLKGQYLNIIKEKGK